MRMVNMMENERSRAITKTPDLEKDYGFSNSRSRRSSTSLSLVGVGETPTDLHEINVYDRLHDSPISPPVHDRCRTTSEYTTTERSTQCTTTCSPKIPLRTECTPICRRSTPPAQRSPSCVPCMSTTTPTCTTQSPTTYSTHSPACSTRSTTCSTRSPTCSTRSPCPTRSPPCTTRSPTCTTRASQCTTRSPKCTTRTTSTCPTRSPDYVLHSTPTCKRATQCTRTSECTNITPTCSTTTCSTTTQCTSTPRIERATECTPCSPGIQSVDSGKGPCPLDMCREVRSRRGSLCDKDDKICPLEVCKLRAGLPRAGSTVGSGSTSTSTAAGRGLASRSIYSSPTSLNGGRKLQFPNKKADDESAGGVVRWTEKCSQRCKRPTWNSNRWNCDKPMQRGCVDCPGGHPASRCAQDYDVQRFAGMDMDCKARKCDCCDKRYSQPAMVAQAHPHNQYHDRGPPLGNCGCDAYARGINHIRRPPMMQPQNPFDNSCSAYFNRLNKGTMPFVGNPPPFNNTVPQNPFGTQYNPQPPQTQVNTVTSRDAALSGLMQEPESFPSPMNSCANHCQTDQEPPPDHSPSQNINMVTNPHMFNNAYMPHNHAVAPPSLNPTRNYPGYRHKYPSKQ